MPITKHGLSSGLVLGPLLFLLNINNLPKIANNKLKIVRNADDTSAIVTNHNPLAFRSEINKVFENINAWFNANVRSLHTDKTYFTQFSTKQQFSYSADYYL
jgi:Reverse transcriptase (RNA-dependent DNA polymerase).